MARPVRWAAALLIAAMGTPNLAAGQTPLQVSLYVLVCAARAC